MAEPRFDARSHRREPAEPVEAGRTHSGVARRSFHSAADDPVEEWKRHARASTCEALGGRNERPILRVHVTLGFLSVGLIIGSIHGLLGSVIIVCVLASVVMAHELSRALFARTLGRSSIVRISAGGSDTELIGAPLCAFARFVFRNIGSAANMLVALGVFWATRRVLAPRAALLSHALALPHAVWGLSQFLPVVPFRNGMDISGRLRPSIRLVHTLISALLVIPIASSFANWTSAPALFAVLVLVIVGCGNALLDAYREARDLHSGVGRIARLAESSLRLGDCERACQKARSGLAAARSGPMRRELCNTLAWAAIGKRDPFLAHGALLELPVAKIDLHLLASYLGTCNRVEEAIELLEHARNVGHRSPETTKLLGDLLFRRGDYAAVFALANGDRGLLSDEDRAMIHRALAERSAAPAG